MRARSRILFPGAAALLLAVAACSGASTPTPNPSSAGGGAQAPASLQPSGPSAVVTLPSAAPQASDQVVLPAAPSPYVNKALEALLPGTYAGATFVKLSLAGPDFLAQDASSPFVGMVSALGLKSTDVSASAAGDPSGQLDVAFGVIRFAGVDSTTLQTAFQSALQSVGDTISTVTIGGRNLIKMKDTANGLVSYGYFYVRADMIIGVTSGDETTATTAAAALP
jgi:hypothetical protein